MNLVCVCSLGLGCVCAGWVACCRMRVHGVAALYVVRVVVAPKNNFIYIYIYIVTYDSSKRREWPILS